MLKLYKNLTKKEIMYIIISLILIVIQVGLELKMPDYMSSITRLVQTEGSKTDDTDLIDIDSLYEEDDSLLELY